MSSPESDRPATPAAASAAHISMKASIKVSAVIDSWVPRESRKYDIRNHNDASNYRIEYVTTPPTLKIAPVDERDLLGDPMKRVASRMAAVESFEDPQQWIENNKQLLAVLGQEIKDCRAKTYREMIGSHAGDRLLAELMIEAIEAGDDPNSLLRDTEALRVRYAELFEQHMRDVVEEKSTLSGKGPFGAFRVVG